MVSFFAFSFELASHNPDTSVFEDCELWSVSCLYLPLTFVLIIENIEALKDELIQ